MMALNDLHAIQARIADYFGEPKQAVPDADDDGPLGEVTLAKAIADVAKYFGADKKGEAPASLDRDISEFLGAGRNRA